MAPQTEATDDTHDGEFKDHRDSVRVGERYNKYVMPDASVIHRGDIVVFDDPDVYDQEIDGEPVVSRLFVGFVESICKMNRDGEPELFVSAGVGRLDPHDSNVGIRGKGIDTTDQMGADSQIEAFITRANVNGREDDPVKEADVSSLCLEFAGGQAHETWD